MWELFQVQIVLARENLFTLWRWLCGCCGISTIWNGQSIKGIKQGICQHPPRWWMNFRGDSLTISNIKIFRMPSALKSVLLYYWKKLAVLTNYTWIGRIRWFKVHPVGPSDDGPGHLAYNIIYSVMMRCTLFVVGHKRWRASPKTRITSRARLTVIILWTRAAEASVALKHQVT